MQPAEQAPRALLWKHSLKLTVNPEFMQQTAPGASKTYCQSGELVQRNIPQPWLLANFQREGMLKEYTHP